MNSMPCKTCPKLDDDIDFIKHDMIDIVSKMQSIEAEDANRNYIATHFGTQAKTLPPLKTKELS